MPRRRRRSSKKRRGGGFFDGFYSAGEKLANNISASVNSAGRDIVNATNNLKNKSQQAFNEGREKVANTIAGKPASMNQAPVEGQPSVTEPMQSADPMQPTQPNPMQPARPNPMHEEDEMKRLPDVIGGRRRRRRRRTKRKTKKSKRRRRKKSRKTKKRRRRRR